MIVEEPIKIERKPMQLIVKVLPIMEYHICTSFGASSEFHRRINNKQAGIGQGHITSVNICRDISYLVIKLIEDQNIGIVMKSPISKEAESEMAVTFVDNTNFGSEGEDYQQKM